MSNANTVQLYFKKQQTYSGFLQSATESGVETFSGSNQKDISLLLEAGGAALVVVKQRKELIN